MAWDEIAPAKYTPWNPAYSVAQLKANSDARVKTNPSFEILSDAAKRLKKQKDNTMVSLNFDKYVAEQKKFKEEAKAMDALDKEIPGLNVESLKADMATADPSDTVRVSKTKELFKAIKKDVYLNETVSIMDDMK